MSRNLSDWLQAYIAFTQRTEPAQLYHLWSGIQAITSCLQRKCWLSWGHQIIYPNLYVLLVGPPGGRKGSAMRIAKSLIQEITIPMSSDCLGSIQTLYKELMDAEQNYRSADGSIHAHKSLSVWSEEFQVFIGDSNPQIIQNLTDLFDAPSTWNYSTLKRGIEGLSCCWLNIFGAITPRLLQSKLSHDAVGGGLLSRLLFVVAYGKEKKVALEFLSPEELQLRDWLIEDLAHIKAIAGEFRFSERAAQVYAEWYNHPDSDRALDDDKFVGYNGRRALHLRKLCMVICASDAHANRVMTEDHFRKALAILQITEREMPNAFFGLGSGQHANVLAGMILAFQHGATLTWEGLLEQFKMDMLPDGLWSVLQSLIQSGKVREERSLSGKVRYIGSEERQADTSNDQELLDRTIFSMIKEEDRL